MPEEESRIRRLNNLMISCDLDACISQRPVDIQYFSNSEDVTNGMLVVIPNAKPRLLVKEAAFSFVQKSFLNGEVIKVALSDTFLKKSCYQY